MKKVGIVSLNFQVYTPNYGCTLQSYALCRKLRELGYNAEIVDYDSSVRRWLCPIAPFYDKRIKWLVSSSTLAWQFQYFINLFSGIRKWLDVRKFLSKYAKVSAKRYSTEAFADDDYGCYVVGSDTIWDIRQMKGFEPAFFGALPGMKKVVAYAPSFGEAVYNQEEANYFQDLLKKFTAVSIREPINMDAFGVYEDKVTTVVDPTMLFSAAEYSKIARRPTIKKPYLLYYVVYNSNDFVTERVDAYAKAHGLEVVEVSVFRQNGHRRFWDFVLKTLKALRIARGSVFKVNLRGISHKMMYGATTQEFLGLVQNAEMVVTNSFHGSVFSILFGRKFYNFARTDASAKLKWICEMLNIGDRFLGPEDVINDVQIDYKRVVFPALDKWRKKSESYLKEAMACATSDLMG